MENLSSHRPAEKKTEETPSPRKTNDLSAKKEKAPSAKRAKIKRPLDALFSFFSSRAPKKKKTAKEPKKHPVQNTAPHKKMTARKDLPPAPAPVPIPAPAQGALQNELQTLYQRGEKKKRLGTRDIIRYAVLFVSIFGFLVAGYFVVTKLLDYYHSYVAYSGLQELVTTPDRFADDYLKKNAEPVVSLTPQDILNGKSAANEWDGAASGDQQSLLGKIVQLKKLNPDTVGWISIDGTVVNYPVLWSRTKNYYLHRDFYGATRAGGAIYVDERCDPNLPENRNIVIYGHNMSDGSMFASIHDFTSAYVFYNTKIQIATENGIYIYEPFSVHQSNAYDNYFETDFASDSDFLDFCETMSFISIYEKPVTFNRNSQIITLSTCMSNGAATDQRFAVHAILVGVRR